MRGWGIVFQLWLMVCFLLGKVSAQEDCHRFIRMAAHNVRLPLDFSAHLPELVQNYKSENSLYIGVIQINRAGQHQFVYWPYVKNSYGHAQAVEILAPLLGKETLNWGGLFRLQRDENAPWRLTEIIRSTNPQLFVQGDGGWQDARELILTIMTELNTSPDDVAGLVWASVHGVERGTVAELLEFLQKSP
jgi:hypothetical protein